MNNQEMRTTLLGSMWFLSAIVLAALFVSAAAMSEFTIWHILFGFVILGLTVTGTVYFVRQPLDNAEQQKAKRQRIDSLLRDMSDDERLALKMRLSDELDEDTVLDYIDEDGELVMRR